jgi:hypothetical protein
MNMNDYAERMKEVEKVSNALNDCRVKIEKSFVLEKDVTEKILVLHNIVDKTVFELNHIKDLGVSKLNFPTDFVAWRCRNIFELNMLLNFLIVDKQKENERFKIYLGESAFREIQYYQNLIKLAGLDERPEKVLARDEVKKRFAGAIKKIQGHLSVGGYEAKHLIEINEMAESLGGDFKIEYDLIYPLFSSFCHGLTWKINATTETYYSRGEIDLFLHRALIYSNDTLSKICKFFVYDIKNFLNN